MQKKIALVATGGTIASTGEISKGDLSASLRGEEVLDKIDRSVCRGQEITVYNYSTVNSVNLTPMDMYRIAVEIKEILQCEDITGVVVTHGTSLMEETAFVLDTLIDSEKPVVLTGSQLGACSPCSDGPANLTDALCVAASREARDKGVLVVFSGKIHEGRLAVKQHTSEFDAFSSGEAGIMGNVYHDQVYFYREKIKKNLRIQGFEEKNVVIMPFYSGADSRYLDMLHENGADGIIVEGVGLGNVNKAYYEAICRLREKGIPVVITSRSSNGRIIPVYGYSGGAASMRDKQVIFSSLSSPKARLLLMLALGGGVAPGELTALFD